MAPRLSAKPARSKAEVVTTALLQAADLLEIRGAQLAEIIGVSEATVSRMRSGSMVLDDTKPKQYEAALHFIRLFRSFDGITGGDHAYAVRWLKTPNRHLNDAPANLIRSFRGLVDTVDYLDAFRAKV